MHFGTNSNTKCIIVNVKAQHLCHCHSELSSNLNFFPFSIHHVNTKCPFNFLRMFSFHTQGELGHSQRLLFAVEDSERDLKERLASERRRAEALEAALRQQQQQQHKTDQQQQQHKQRCEIRLMFFARQLIFNRGFSGSWHAVSWMTESVTSDESFSFNIFFCVRPIIMVVNGQVMMGQSIRLAMPIYHSAIS